MHKFNLVLIIVIVFMLGYAFGGYTKECSAWGSAPGRYMIAPSGDTGLWILDTQNGYLWTGYIGKPVPPPPPEKFKLQTVGPFKLPE